MNQVVTLTTEPLCSKCGLVTGTDGCDLILKRFPLLRLYYGNSGSALILTAGTVVHLPSRRSAMSTL